MNPEPEILHDKARNSYSLRGLNPKPQQALFEVRLEEERQETLRQIQRFSVSLRG